jgi:tetratricopeptide (TPR) repeat protein
VPGGRQSLRRSGDRLLGLTRPHLLTLVVAAAVFGLALNHGTYGAVDRHSVAIGVWWALALALGLSLWPLARPTRAALVAGSLLAALAGLTALSIVWADSAERAFAEFNRVTLYLGVLALAVAAGTRANAHRWSDGIAIGVTAVGLLALLSRLFPELVNVDDLFLLLPDVKTRLSYPVDYWNGLGILIGLGFPPLLRAATAARGQLWRGLALAPLPALVGAIYLTSSRGAAAVALAGTIAFVAFTGRRLAAAGAALSAAAFSAAVIAVLLARPELVDGPLESAAAASQGRGAAPLIAAACAACGLFWALAPRLAARRGFRLQRRAQTALAALGIVAVLAGVIAADPVERFESFKRPPTEVKDPDRELVTGHLLSANSSGRWQYWESAIDQFESRPAVGHGAGSYEAWWAEHAGFPRFIRDAHSLYLETLGELGLAGALLLLALFGCGAVAAAGRLRRASGDDRATIAALAAVFLAFSLAAAIDWMWELTVVGMIGIGCLGLLVGPATERSGRGSLHEGEERARGRGRRSERRSSEPLVSSRATHGWPRIALATLGLSLIFAQAIPLLSQTRIDDSRAAVERGDLVNALDEAQAARRLQPWAASPHLQLALVREEAGDLGSARRSIRRAIDNDPSDWRLWLVTARLDAKAGLIPEARRSLERARSLNPRSPLLAPRGERSRE